MGDPRYLSVTITCETSCSIETFDRAPDIWTTLGTSSPVLFETIMDRKVRMRNVDQSLLVTFTTRFGNQAIVTVKVKKTATSTQLTKKNDEMLIILVSTVSVLFGIVCMAFGWWVFRQRQRRDLPPDTMKYVIKSESQLELNKAAVVTETQKLEYIFSWRNQLNDAIIPTESLSLSTGTTLSAAIGNKTVFVPGYKLFHKKDFSEIKRLAKGGYSTVYLMQANSSQIDELVDCKPVAVKIINNPSKNQFAFELAIME